MPRRNEAPDFSAFYREEENAARYDAIHADTLKKRVVRALETNFLSAPLAAPLCQQRILEIGAGTGEITAPLAQNNSVLAVDISDSMLDIAKAKCRNLPVQFQTLDMFELESLPGTFDTIVANRVFLHLEQDSLLRMLKLSAKKIKPGGLLLFDLQRPSLWRKILGAREKHKVKNPNYSLELINDLLDASGFWSLEKHIAFDHWLLLGPTTALSGNVLPRLQTTLVSLETALQNVSLTASRWGIVCRAPF